jgi:hypothetical protein
MTEAAPEPTNRDLLEFMQTAFAHLTTELGKTNAKVDEVALGLTDVAANLDGVREELRGEIRASEARVLSRVASLQQVVQNMKTDLSRHVDDGGHHRHAA